LETVCSVDTEIAGFVDIVPLLFSFIQTKTTQKRQ
jgi:hypothetical protein